MITGKSANEEFTKHYGKAGYTGVLQGAVREHGTEHASSSGDNPQAAPQGLGRD